jgi:Fe(3+) dicitrate transport protein
MKKNQNIIILLIALFNALMANAQQKDSIKLLQEVRLAGYVTVHGMGHLLDVRDGIIYGGKKTEVIIVDSLDANKAINNTRQILGRIPGLNIVETESSGFTANGIATRGLNPIQCIEMNIRQNGYNISADVYGYNEAYYIPPTEAVKRIELIRGASSLQFGAQFGGMVNYVTEEVPKNKPFEFTTSQTEGSFGLFNSFNAIGGNYKKISYYGFFQYRNMDGYRPNSQQWQLSGFGKVEFKPSEKMNIGLEYSLLRNRIQMPGGLTDSIFYADPRASTRARNWLKSPWNIVSNYINIYPSKRTTISLKNTFIFSSRSLVWRNEDGGPAAPDTIDHATNQYVPREVGVEDMHSIASETRFSTNYDLWNNTSTLAGGVRIAYAWFKRQGGGQGTTGSDFNLSITGDWGYNLDFTSVNVAPFLENIFKVSRNFTITPGLRVEYLRNTAEGYKTTDGVKQSPGEDRTRTFSLAGIGLDFKPTGNSSVYGNISQAYRPIDYSQLEPFGVAAKIDPNLKDSYGFNSDLGYRTTVKNYFNLDVSLFFLAYNRRIADIVRKDSATGLDYAYRTNAANSVHKGMEAYFECNILRFLDHQSKQGISIFNSFGYTDARYTTGPYKGNRVETAAKVIERVGINYNNKTLSATFQVNYVSDAFGDASNVRVSDNPIAGYIPAYTVLDFSATYKINNYAVKAGVNNIADKSYFTRRTDEYPGPGIIPAVGRSLYIGLTGTF